MKTRVTRRAVRTRLMVQSLEAREVPAYVVAAGTFEPNDLTAGDSGVTSLISGTDDATTTVSLGSNTFNFYGTVVNSLVVSTNGLISLAQAVPNDQDNTGLTTDPAQAVIAPLWDDWLKTSGQPMVLSYFDGSRLIIEWDQVKSANLPPTSSPVTFQAILELNTGNTSGSIKFNYIDTDTGTDSIANDGAGATVGVKRPGVVASSPNPGPSRTLIWKDGTANGSVAPSSTSAIQLTWLNTAPVITPAGLTLSASPITEGGTVRLSGTFDEVDVTDGHSVSINWGDGSATENFTLEPEVLEFNNIAHVYANNPANQPNGSYTITVKVTDTPGASATASVQVGVHAAAPALALQVPATVNVLEGTELSFSTLAKLTSSGFGPRAAFSYSINWGDGTAPNMGTAAITQVGSAGVPTAAAFGGSHTYGDDGTYTVTVSAADEDGLTSSRTFQVVVANIVPTLSLVVTPPVSSQEGGQLSLPELATFTDPGFGLNETFPFSINWGDGTPTDTGFASITTAGSPGILTAGKLGGGHTYMADGTYTVTVTLADDNGGSDTKQFTVDVADVAPHDLAVSLNRTTLTEGETALLAASFADVADPEPHTLTVDWGDGSSVTTMNLAAGITSVSNLAHSYVNNPFSGTTYTVTVTIANSGGLSDVVSRTVVVKNQLPTVNAGPHLETLIGQSATLKGTAADVGLADTLTYQWEVFDANGDLQAQSPGLTFTFVPSQPGVYTARFTVTDDVGSASAETLIRVRPVNRYAVAAGAGNPGVVNVFDGGSNTPTFTLTPYGSAYRRGIRVAVGDVNGDAVPDIITATTRNHEVKIFDGKTGIESYSFLIAPQGYNFGLHVAAGDVNEDGYDDIIVSPTGGARPLVRIYSGQDGTFLRSFFAFNPSYLGGVRLAVGDVTGDGAADIIAGASGGRQVRVFDGRTGIRVRSIFAFSQSYVGGIWVSAGDLNGDGRAEVIVGPSIGSQVQVFDGISGARTHAFTPFGPRPPRGVRVAVADVDGDGQLEILAAAGFGAPRVAAFRLGNPTPVMDFLAMDANFTNGLFIGSGD